ncbi:hypothetical protein LCGC14_0940890 [marine sediment metagenome]|uniref:DUF4062 domain-containing protein n=1 Tax=marine sediment metagenome TaxID=412755 RepID=A0A0F9P688_9ZZZZ
MEQVFLCGTDDVFWIFESLEKSLREMGFEPIWFHNKFKVEDQDTMQTCINNVKNSDRLILIINKRYGLPSRYTRNDGNISITEEEFLTAAESDKKILIFIERSVYEQSKFYRKLIKNTDLDITEENKKKFGLKAKLNTYAFIDRIQHMKSNGIFNIRWIEHFQKIEEIINKIKLKWQFEEGDLYISFKGDIDEYSITQAKHKINSEEEIEKEKNEIRENLIHIPGELNKEKQKMIDLIKEHPYSGGIGGIIEVDWSLYNVCVEIYSEKYGEYLLAMNEYNKKKTEQVGLDFEMHNNSQSTFYDITVYIKFPKGLEIFQDILGEPPNPPDPPPKPSKLQILFNRNHDFKRELSNYKDKIERSSYAKLLSNAFSSIMPDMSLLMKSPFRILDNNKIQIKLDKLTQEHYFEINGYKFRISATDPNKEFEIKWEIFTGSPSLKKEGNLKLKTEDS